VRKVLVVVIIVIVLLPIAILLARSATPVVELQPQVTAIGQATSLNVHVRDPRGVRAARMAARAAAQKALAEPRMGGSAQLLYWALADGEGRVFDFHALRHLFISRVVGSGASVKVCQELARHSSPVLTLGRYAHVRLADLRKALPTVREHAWRINCRSRKLLGTASLSLG